MKSRIYLGLALTISLLFSGLYYYLLDNYWLYIDNNTLSNSDDVWPKFYAVYATLTLASIIWSFKNIKHLLVSAVYLLVFPAIHYSSDFVSYTEVKNSFYDTAKIEYKYEESLIKNLKNKNYPEVEKILAYIESTINKGEGDELAIAGAYNAFYSSDNEIFELIVEWNKKHNSYHSQYALGIVYLAKAWQLRGDGLYSEIPVENISGMNEMTDNSLHHLTSAMDLKDNLWVSYYYLFNALALAGKHSDAKLLFEQSMKTYPYSLSLRYKYLSFHLRPQWGGSLEKVKQFALDARKLSKYNARLMSVYGYYYDIQASFHEGYNPDDNIELYLKALEYAPLTMFYKGILYTYSIKKDFKNKLKYKTLIMEKLSPEKGNYMERAYIYHSLNKPLLAFADIEKELQLYPDDPDTYNQAGYIYYIYEEYNKAISAFNNTIRVDHDNIYALKQRGDLHARTHQPDKALESYLRLYDIDSSEIRLDLLIADAMYDLKMVEAYTYINKYFKRIDADNPENNKDIQIAKTLMHDIKTAGWYTESSQ